MLVCTSGLGNPGSFGSAVCLASISIEIPSPLLSYLLHHSCTSNHGLSSQDEYETVHVVAKRLMQTMQHKAITRSMM